MVHASGPFASTEPSYFSITCTSIVFAWAVVLDAFALGTT